MSFSLGGRGTKNEVKAQIEAAVCNGDPSQFNAAKAFVLAEVAAAPDGKTVSVNCSGHHSNDTRSLSLSLSTSSP